MTDLLSRIHPHRPVANVPARADLEAPLPAPARLTLTPLAFTIGFFAVPPLAAHLGTAIGMAGWMVGSVLGLRTFSQQGMRVVGARIVLAGALLLWRPTRGSVTLRIGLDPGRALGCGGGTAIMGPCTAPSVSIAPSGSRPTIRR